MVIRFQQLVFFLLLANGFPAAGHAQLVADPPALSFGTFDNLVDAVKPLTLSVKNVTTHDITINAVQVGCGCLFVNWRDAVTLSPGGSTAITVNINPELVHVGVNTYSMSAFLDDQNTFQLPKVHYEFKPKIKSEANDLFLAADDRGEFSATCKVVAAADVTQMFVSVNSDDFIASVEPTSAGSHTYTVLAKLAADAPWGMVSGTLKLRLDPHGKDYATISLHARHDIGIVPDPEMLVFGEFTQKSPPLNRDILLRGRDDLEIVKCTSSSDAVAVTIVTGGNGKHLRVSIDPKRAPSGIVKGVIDVEFGKSPKIIVSIPFIGHNSPN